MPRRTKPRTPRVFRLLKRLRFVSMLNAMESPSSQPTLIGETKSGLAEMTALIVDDEAHIREYLRLVLKTLGLTTVWEAGNGEEGFKLYQEHRPSVVLLDVNMPIMSGDELMQQFAVAYPDAVVIAVTSQNEHEMVKRFIKLGATGYLLKHLPKDQIIRRLAEVLGRIAEADEEPEAAVG